MVAEAARSTGGRIGFLDFVRGEAPVLQVALDYTKAEDALLLASRLRCELGPVFIAEAGTPLVKAEGLRVVSLLDEVVDPAPVLADMKTVDTGALEVELASWAGADAATVLALAPDETIEEAAKEAKRRNIALVADLMGVSDPVKRAEELASLGVDVVEVHVGIDVQRRLGVTAAGMAEIVRRIVERFPGPVAVAGGLNEETAPRMVEAGASIIVVGGAITRSRDPVEAARRIIEAVRKAAGRG